MDFEYVPNFDVDMYGYDDYGSQTLSQPNLPSSSNSQQPTEEKNNDISNLTEIPKFQPYFPSTSKFESCFPSTSKSPLKRTPTKRTPTKRTPTKKALPKKSPKKRTPKKKSPSKNLEDFKTPTNTAPLLNIHANFSMKILKTQGITPFPNYSSMLEGELNDHLNKFGIRPMGRKRAIEELTRIYEATHPIIDEKTPTRERIWNAISGFNERPKKKPAVSRKRPAPAEFNQDEPIQVLKPQQTIETATADILTFLRLPQNYDLYNDCLTLKSILLERLMETFSSFLSEKSISKDSFMRILDHLHITYSDKRDEKTHYHH